MGVPPVPSTFRPHKPLSRFFGGIALVGVATLACVPFHAFVSPVNLLMLYQAAVVVAVFLPWSSAATPSAGLSVLAFDFLFVQPRFSFAVTDTEYLLSFAGLFIAGPVVRSLAAQSRDQAEAAQRRDAGGRSLRVEPRSRRDQRDGEHPGSRAASLQRDVQPGGGCPPSLRQRAAAASREPGIHARFQRTSGRRLVLQARPASRTRTDTLPTQPCTASR